MAARAASAASAAVVDPDDGVHRPAALGQLPGGDAHHRRAQAEGEGDLRQGAELAADGHHHVGGADHQQVAGLAQPGGHRHLDVGVGMAPVVAGKDADRSGPRPPGRPGTPPP